MTMRIVYRPKGASSREEASSWDERLAYTLISTCDSVGVGRRGLQTRDEREGGAVWMR